MLTDLYNETVNAPKQLVYGGVAIALVLTIGSIAGLILPRTKAAGSFKDLGTRVNSWWVIVAIIAGGLMLHWQGTSLVFAAISFLSLREFLSLAPARREDRIVIALSYLTIPASYIFIWLHIYMFYLVFVPVWVFLVTPTLMAFIGQTRGFLTSTSIFHWATMTCVYNLGFIPLLMLVPRWDAPQAGGAGLVLMLLIATEANDVFQYIVGKLIGRRKILPRVSPNKTWEGFLGGWILTAALIIVLGPVFTPLAGLGLWAVAISLPLAGFAGDVTFSAIKRDLGVKDTSGFIPGHGGVLDRLDSLTFTAPLYFHLLAFFALQTY